jgi:hypothetical protein
MNKTQENQMESYKKAITASNRKARREQLLAMIQAEVLLKDLLNGVQHDIEAIAADFRMTIIQAIRCLAGPWGNQKIHRHGSQPGYVFYAGRKVSLVRPRARHPEQQGSIAELQGLSRKRQDAASRGRTAHPPMLHARLCRSH